MPFFTTNFRRITSTYGSLKFQFIAVMWKIRENFLSVKQNHNEQLKYKETSFEIPPITTKNKKSEISFQQFWRVMILLLSCKHWNRILVSLKLFSP